MGADLAGEFANGRFPKLRSDLTICNRDSAAIPIYSLMSMTERPPQINVAIVGVTGAVGQELGSVLAQSRLPIGRLRVFASERSQGRTIEFAGRQCTCEVLREGCFEGSDLALFSAGKSISSQWCPRAVAEGAWVVDNSSCFRMTPGVPLIVPEINGAELSELNEPGIIANPNCSTIIALMAVTPIHRRVPVRRMVVATYQAASGAGAAAMHELEQQARDFAAGKSLNTTVLGRQCLFNCFSHNSAIGADGYNEEERKLLHETRRIWGDSQVRVSATCVRIPTLRAHAEAINLTLDGSMTAEEARELLSRAPGVRVVDDREGNRFPEPLAATGQDDVLVGRIRADMGQDPGHGLELFVAGDQIRKGAALNAVQIAELIFAPRTALAARA